MFDPDGCPPFPTVDVARLLPVLPLDCSTSLDIAGKTAQVFESALESGRLSLKQGASCASCFMEKSRWSLILGDQMKIMPMDIQEWEETSQIVDAKK